MTTHLPSIVCPVDFSETSRTALRYASLIADHFGARLTVLTVDDPLLVEAAKATGAVPSPSAETERELRRFCVDTVPDLSTESETVEFRVAVGKAASEILRVAAELPADLLVISSHGRSGARKIFFGSTTERVLRETTVPVLVTPATSQPPVSLADIARHINRVVAPVDLSDASPRQVKVAGGIALSLSVPLIVTHVLEPIFVPQKLRAAISGVEASRHEQVEEALARITTAVPAGIRPESIVVTGDPSEEIVRLADARQANLIVIGLHSSGLLGPRMGSVTYRVLSLTRSLVLAIPPVPVHHLNGVLERGARGQVLA